jgi:carbon storage regulator
MLVMRRRAGETFLIGEAIEIEILAIGGARVKLGIVAPDSVVIQRKETQITRDENISAARSVEKQNISSLLNQVAFQADAEPVKNLTGATILTAKGNRNLPKKTLEQSGHTPDMNE